MTLPIIAILMILAGLAMVCFADKARYPILCILVFWSGIALIIIGLILLLTPVLVWIYNQLRSAFAV